MAFYAQIYGYQPVLVPGELCHTLAEAKAHDRAALIDELSGLTPETIEKALAEGLTDRQEELLDLLRDLAREAKYRPRAVEHEADPAPATVPADSYATAAE